MAVCRSVRDPLVNRDVGICVVYAERPRLGHYKEGNSFCFTSFSDFLFPGAVTPVAFPTHSRRSPLPLQTFPQHREHARWGSPPRHPSSSIPLPQSQVLLRSQTCFCQCHSISSGVRNVVYSMKRQWRKSSFWMMGKTCTLMHGNVVDWNRRLVVFLMFCPEVEVKRCL